MPDYNDLVDHFLESAITKAGYTPTGKAYALARILYGVGGELGDIEEGIKTLLDTIYQAKDISISIEKLKPTGMIKGDNLEVIHFADKGNKDNV